MAVVSDRITKTFHRFGATQTVTLDISKTYDRVWHAVLLHKLKSYGISCCAFGLILSFLINRWLQVVLGGKSSQEYPLDAGVPQGFILGPNATLFPLHIILYEIGTKLGSNWEQNMLYTKSFQILCRKKMSILTGLKVSSLPCKCVFYRPEHNANGEPHEIEF